MKATITIEVPDDMDLDHTLESTTDAMYYSDCVTSKEENFVIELIQQIKKQVDNERN
jgi:hypothetical protein